MQVQLIHTHLPKLQDSEIIEWDRTDDTVTLAPDASVASLEASDRNPTATAETDRATAAIVDPTRRRIRSVVETESRLSLEELADSLADGEPDQTLLISLHHSHLPAMADDGHLEYDFDSTIVSTRE